MASPRNQNLVLTLAASELKQPLHIRVRQILRERILTDFKHGQRFYSERELMQKLGVSQATIRRALSDLVGEGYLQTDPRRGFFVQRLEQVKYVGMITPASGSRLVAASAEYAEICRQHNYILNIYGFHKTDTVDDIMRSLQRKPSEERIILMGLTVDLTLELGLRLKSEGYQHIVVGSRISGFTGGSVSQDHDSEVDLILDYLTKLGHRRILFLVNEPKNLLITNLRAEKIQQKIEQRNLAETQLVFCDTRNWGDSFEAAYKKVDTIMQSKPVPTAIVPLSGVGAWAVLRYAVEHHIRVPQQLSIVSFDPMINSDLLPIPLTELTFSHEERAEKALKILWSEQAQSNELVTSKLVPRASTGAPLSK